MKESMRKDLEQYGWIIDDEATWVHPWKPYWRLIVKDRASVVVTCKELSKRYPEYGFSVGETHIKNIIYTTIIIGKRK